MAIEVGERFGVVTHHGIEVEGLRVGQIRIWNGRGDRRPIRREPAAEARCVVTGAEVVVAGFGVTFLTLIT